MTLVDDFGREWAQLVGMLVEVMRAEQQVAASTQHNSNVSLSSTAVATI
jgi:hypothetical protein